MFFGKKKQNELAQLKVGIDHQLARLHNEINLLRNENVTLVQQLNKISAHGFAEELTLKQAEKAIADVATLSTTLGEVQWAISDLKHLTKNIARNPAENTQAAPEQWKKENSSIRVKLGRLTERLEHLEKTLEKNAIIRAVKPTPLASPTKKWEQPESWEKLGEKIQAADTKIPRGDTRYKPFSAKSSHGTKTATRYERFTDTAGKGGVVNTATGELFMGSSPDTSSDVRSLFDEDIHHDEFDLDEEMEVDREIDYDPEEWN